MLCSRSLLSGRACADFYCSGQEKYPLSLWGVGLEDWGGCHHIPMISWTLMVSGGSRVSESETYHQLNESDAVGKVFHEGGHRGVTIRLKLGV